MGTHWGAIRGEVAARDSKSLKSCNRPLQCEPEPTPRHPMVILSSAAAFGFIGLVSIFRDRPASAFHNFIWCLVLLISYFFFSGFPQ